MALDATVGGANANSFDTVEHADEYFADRLPLPSPWEDQDNKGALLIMATRSIVAQFQMVKLFVPETGGVNARGAYYVTPKRWSGQPASSTQRLPWPRIGMYDANGNAIAPDVIPDALKEATDELAGAFGQGDRTQDNDVAVQGITGIKVGTIALQFKSQIATTKVLPDFVMSMLPASWFLDEVVEYVDSFQFEVSSNRHHHRRTNDGWGDCF